MAEVKVLIEGYAKKLENGWIASSTACLIYSESKKIITDPGCNRKRLLEALAREKLATGDIDYVFTSHAHPDHGMLAGIFENARHITWDSGLRYDGDSLTEYKSHDLGPDIEIIQTPGHMLEHISLLINTAEGRIAIAGDAIFWLDGEEQVFDINKEDPSQAKGLNHADLVASRKKLIKLADYIIPGHGKIFKVAKQAGFK